MVGVAARTYEQIVAFGKETTFGTPVSPTIAIPVTDFSMSPTFEPIYDEGRRGLVSMDYSYDQGAGHSEWTMEGLAYPEEIGHLIYMILGTVAVTGADPYVHVFTVGTAPPSYTIIERVTSGANGSRQFSGARVTSLTFSWNAGEGALAYSVQGLARIPTTVAADGTVAAVDAEAWPSWNQVVVSTDLAGLVTSGEITITREGQIVHVGEASQDARHITQGGVRVEGNMLSIIEDDLTGIHAKYLAGTTQSLVVTFDIDPDNRSIIFTMTAANLAATPVDIDRSGVSVFNRINFRALHNATDSGPIQIDLENSFAAY